MKPAFDSISDLLEKIKTSEINPSDLCVQEYDSTIHISIKKSEDMLNEYSESIISIEDTQKQYLYIGNSTDLIKQLLHSC